MRIATAWFVIATAALAAPVDVGTPEHAKATDLVKQLGHSRYSAREAAAKKLVEMAGASVPALREGLNATDEEVRVKCAALLPLAKALDWQRKSDAYLADASSKEKSGLPLVAEFEKVVGKPDAAARKLFAEVVRTNGPFLEQVQNEPSAAARTIETRAGDLYRSSFRRVGPDELEALSHSAGDLAALFLADTATKEKSKWDGTKRESAAWLLGHKSVTAAFGDPVVGPAFRKVLVAWATSRSADDISCQLSFSHFARRHAFPVAVPLLSSWLKQPGCPVGAYGLGGLVTAGTPEAAAAIEDLLTNQSNIWLKHRGQDPKPELRDSALGALIKLRDGNPKDYGLTSVVQLSVTAGGARGNRTIDVYRFPTTEARIRAFDKWKAETGKKN